MPRQVPELTRCSLSISHLGKIEVFPVSSTDQATILHILVDLEQGLSVWRADDAIRKAVFPVGLKVHTDTRVPSAGRLVLEATFSGGLPIPGAVARLTGQIIDALIALEKK